MDWTHFWYRYPGTILVITAVVILFGGLFGLMWINTLGEYQDNITVKEKQIVVDVYVIVDSNDIMYKVSSRIGGDGGMWNRMKVNSTYLVTLDPSGQRILEVNFDGQITD